jgi:hypothetical protein
VDEQGEILLAGEIRERPIAAGETHVYNFEVTVAPAADEPPWLRAQIERLKMSGH